MACQSKYPSIFKEAFEDQVGTNAERVQALYTGLEEVPLLSESVPSATVAVTAETLERIAALPNAGARTAAMNVAINEVIEDRIRQNAVIQTRNRRNRLMEANIASAEAAKEAVRLEMAAWMLTDEVISRELYVEVTSDGDYSDVLGANSCRTIMKIFTRLYGGGGAPNSKARNDARASLMGLKQLTVPIAAHNAYYKMQLKQCLELGATFQQEELVDGYVYNLNSNIFREFIARYAEREDGHGMPGEIHAMMKHVAAWYNRRLLIHPELAKYTSSEASRNLTAFDADVMEDDDIEAADAKLEEPAGKGSGKETVCQICDKVGHVATKCWKLTNPKFVENLVASMDKRPRARKLKGNDKDKDADVGCVDVVITSSPTQMEITSVSACATSRVGPVSFAEAIEIELSPVVYCDSCNVRRGTREAISVCESDDWSTEVILDIDNHASMSVIRPDSEVVFEYLAPYDAQLRGVVPGAKTQITQKGNMVLDMGEGVVLNDARSNLVAHKSLIAAYDLVECTNDTNRYRHKVNGQEIVFRADEDVFGDVFMHCVLLFSSNGINVSSMDFFNPAPKAPVPPANYDAIVESIGRAERLHLAANHPSVPEMHRFIELPSYNGVVTRRDVELFAKHQGCSACAMGKMAAHDQLPSRTGLSAVVGQTAQGDLFYVEGGGVKVPVLIVVDEASLFGYAHVFLSAMSRRKSDRIMVNTNELHEAFIGAYALWASHGHSLTELRFDREKSGTSSVMTYRNRVDGVQVVLTSAGQKLGLIERYGGLIKNQCRSVIAGIREKYGYTYPESFYPRLVVDAVCVRNRLVPTTISTSPIQHFIGPEHGIDVEHDLRAAIGEILLFHKPKRGASVSIGPTSMKAEWGIVVGRRFNGKGTLEVYLLETKSYGERFKFVRLSVPAHILQLAIDLRGAVTGSKLTKCTDSNAATDDVPDEDLQTDRASSVPEPENVNEEEEKSETDIQLECADSAQVSYKRALKKNPERAEAAMTDEIQNLLNKGVLNPVHLHDIPTDQRDLIMNSLTGVKDKYSPTGEFEKAKGRAFVDGSKQDPELVGECSSPVARNESVMMHAGIGAYRGDVAFTVDVVGAFLNTERPKDAEYRYLRLSKELAEILVKLKPEYQKFVTREGTCYVQLNKMLYGEKNAGKLWYEDLMKFFVDNGFTRNSADPCVVHYLDNEGYVDGTISTDDVFLLASSNELKVKVINMFSQRFGIGGFTVSEGDSLNLLGLHFEFDRVKGRVLVSQPKFVAELLVKAGVISTYAKTPGGPELFNVPLDEIPLSEEERDEYRSLNQSLMFAASRTYPECLPAACVLAGRYVDCTQADREKLQRAISYLGRDPTHCLVIRPESLIPVCSCDASYGCHADGKGHTGVCAGFKGKSPDSDSYCIFHSGKQSIVTKSSCESELVASNDGGSLLVWMVQLLAGYRVDGKGGDLYRNANVGAVPQAGSEATLYQDNESTIKIINKGHGTFKNTRHVRVRYFFIHDLVVWGWMKVKWMASASMVADMLSKGVALGVFSALLPRLIGRR